MIRDLDDTIEQLLTTQAEEGSELATASISFELPNADWRAALEGLTVNCYLYDIRENRELRTVEPPIQWSADGSRAIRRQAPARIDCAYCITAWSTANDDAVREEHRVLSQVLRILLQNPTVPTEALRGSLITQIPPYPTVVASDDVTNNLPEFWGALDQQLKPSLNYIITLAMSLDESPEEGDMAPRPGEVRITVDDPSEAED